MYSFDIKKNNNQEKPLNEKDKKEESPHNILLTTRTAIIKKTAQNIFRAQGYWYFRKPRNNYSWEKNADY